MDRTSLKRPGLSRHPLLYEAGHGSPRDGLPDPDAAAPVGNGHATEPASEQAPSDGVTANAGNGAADTADPGQAVASSPDGIAGPVRSTGMTPNQILASIEEIERFVNSLDCQR